MEISQTADPQVLAKEKLKQNIQRIFIQLTKGCGRVPCKNKFCASNPTVPTSTVEEALTKSFQVAKTGNSEFICPEQESLNLKSLVILLEEAKATNDFRNIIRKIGTVFSSDSLNISFLQEEEYNPTTFGVDMNSVQEAYRLLMSQPANIVNSLAFASERLTAQLRSLAPHCTKGEHLRQFFILLENPLLGDHTYHKTIFGPLCTAVVSLPKQSQTLLMNWLETFSPQHFGHTLGLIRQFITLKILLSPSVNLNRDEHIISCVKFMDMFNTINNKKKMLPYTDFYNESVNERIELKEDFIIWKKENGFSFCNYPFILEPAVKSKVLQIESIVQQRQQRDEAFRQLFLGFGLAPPVLVVKVRRDHLIEDSLADLSRHPPEDLKKELKVKFMGEEGVDEGGVQKEWFQLVVREIFDPKYGMFILNSETRTFWFNNISSDFLEFQLIGMLLGLAIYNGVILDLHFPFVVYKKLMGQPVDLTDLKETHPGLEIAFRKLLAFDGDVEEIYGQTFQIQYEVFGEIRYHNLKENGDKIPLTNQNRQEYVNLYTKWLLEDSVKRQFDEFMKGFSMICDSPAFRMFRAEELELLVCGSPTLDFEALEKNCLYDNGYHKDHQVIRWFWEVVHSMSLEEKKKLLFFSTGSDRAPIGGLSKMMFIVARHGTGDERLPSAHTCFNHFLLPEYNSKEKLREKLLSAISNAEGFGLM